MDTELKQETPRIWIHTYNDKSRGLVDAHDVRCAGCTPYVPATELARVRRETWDAAIATAKRIYWGSSIAERIVIALEAARDESEKQG